MVDRVGFDISLELINGLKVGIEHMSLSEEDDEDYGSVIICEFVFIRLALLFKR